MHTRIHSLAHKLSHTHHDKAGTFERVHYWEQWYEHCQPVSFALGDGHCPALNHPQCSLDYGVCYTLPAIPAIVRACWSSCTPYTPSLHPSTNTNPFPVACHHYHLSTRPHSFHAPPEYQGLLRRSGIMQIIRIIRRLFLLPKNCL